MAIILDDDQTIEQFEWDSESATFTQMISYRMTAGEQLVDALAYAPIINRRHRDSRLSRYVLKKVSLKKLAGNAGNGCCFNCQWEIPTGDSVSQSEEDMKPDLDTPPWTWPVSNYKVASMQLEQSLDDIYDYSKLPEAEGYKVPLLSSAGTEIIASTNRSMSIVSFSYNLQTFNEANIFAYAGCANYFPVRIASINYPAATIMLQEASAEPRVIAEDGNEENPTGIKWRFYRINVQFLVDPKTFERKYQNRSTFFIPRGSTETQNGPAQIWTCTGASGSSEVRYFGTLSQIEKICNEATEERHKRSGQAVTEPMYLAENGAINNWDSGTLQLTAVRQTPTYITGIPHPGSDFAGLQLPPNKRPA